MMQPLRWVLVGLLAVCPSGFRIRQQVEVASISQDGAASAWTHGKLSTKLWTWNSGKKDLAAEAHALAQSDEDVLVTCQTEAKAHIKDARLISMSNPWKLVASAEHWGFAGGSNNAQMIGVFLKDPARSMRLTGDMVSVAHSSALRSTFKSWENAYRPSLGTWVSVRPSAAGNGTAPILSVRAMTIATDYKGKGGAAVTLMLPATPFRKKTTITYICAHLDAQSEEARSQNLRLFWAAVRAPDSLTAWRTLVGNATTILQKPMCAFFDNTRRGCSVAYQGAAEPDVAVRAPDSLTDWRTLVGNAKTILQKTMGAFFDGTPRGPSVAYQGAAEPDVLMLFGDLNFRIRADSQNRGFKVADVTSYVGRRYLSRTDYLKAGGPNQMELTKSVASGNMGFECNQPYDIMPPSYKRIAAEECTNLGKHLKLCGNPGQAECNAAIKAMAVRCYLGEEGTADASFGTKGNDLQTGWLDRTCIRTVDTSAAPQNKNLRIAFDVSKEKGWTEVPGKKDEVNGGDHMPVESTVSIWREGCLCEQLPANRDLRLECGKGQVDTPTGKSFTVTCKAGKSFGSSVKSLRVVCASDGKIRVATAAGTPIFERTCA